MVKTSVRIALGAALIGTLFTAWYRSGGPAPVAAAAPLFMQAANAASLRMAWPPADPAVAFNEEMFALAALAAPPRTTVSQRAAPVDTSAQQTGGPQVRPHELIVIRDRFGRPIRVDRGPL